MTFINLAIVIVLSGSGNDLLSPILILSSCVAQCTNATDCVNCERNWFGPKCQLRDLLQFSTLHDATELTDRNDLTCENRPRDELDVPFTTPQFFVWMYLVFTPSTVLWLTEFHLALNVSYVLENCTNLRQVTESLHKVYITCSHYGVTEALMGVRLSWTSLKTLCSVYVFGGRNVALQREVSLVNVVGTLQDQPKSVVDGIKTSNCTRSQPGSMMQTLIVDFGAPKLVYEIIIYRTPRDNDFHPMTNFIMALVTENDSVVYANFNQGHDRGDQVLKLSVEKADPAQRLRFYLYPGNQAEVFYFDLCEVEVFGDCSMSRYGVDCENTCMARCHDGRCLPNGFCLDCDLKNNHKYCSKEAELHRAQFRSLSLVLGAACHCNPMGCDSSCQNRTECFKGWFGHNCLYNEFSPFVEMNHVMVRSAEDGDGACVITNEVRVMHSQVNSFGIAWMEVTLAAGAHHTDTDFLSNVATKSTGCQQFHVTQPTKENLVFYCEGGKSINSGFILRLPTNISVCSTRLVTGRSLMHLTETDLVSRSDAIPRKSPVGGSIRPLPYRLHPGAAHALVIRFQAPVFPYNIVMYTDNEMTEDVQLEIKYLTNDLQLMVDTLDYTALDYKYIFHHHPRDPVDTVVVKVMKGQMVVLYLHVLGECAPPSYGVSCTEECPTMCEGRRCYVDGSCFRCNDSAQGFNKAASDDGDGQEFSYFGMAFLIGVAVAALLSTVLALLMFRDDSIDTPNLDNLRVQTTENPASLNKVNSHTVITNYMVFTESHQAYVVGLTSGGEITEVNVHYPD